MPFKGFVTCQEGSSGANASCRIPSEIWETHRAFLTDLHQQGLPRSEILKKAENIGFSPSIAQLHRQFRNWGLKVYLQQDRQPSSDQTSAGNDTTPNEPDDVEHEPNGQQFAESFFSAAMENLKAGTLQAIANLAAFFHSTQSYNCAYHLYRRLYTILSYSLSHDNVLRFGVLINCARSASNEDDLKFVRKELRTILMGGNKDRNQTQTFRLKSDDVDSALSWLTTNRSNWLDGLFATCDDDASHMETLYDTSRVQTLTARCLFDPTSAERFQYRAESCVRLFKLVTSFLKVGVDFISEKIDDLQLDINEAVTVREENDWNVIRRLLLVLYADQLSLRCKVKSLWWRSSVSCECESCTAVEDVCYLDRILSINSLAALAIIVYEQILHPSTTNRAQHRPTSIGLAAKLDVQHDASQNNAGGFQCQPEFVDDFFRTYRACCQPRLAFPEKADICMSSDLVDETQRLFLKTCEASVSKSSSMEEVAPPSREVTLADHVAPLEGCGRVISLQIIEEENDYAVLLPLLIDDVILQDNTEPPTVHPERPTINNYSLQPAPQSPQLINAKGVKRNVSNASLESFICRSKTGSVRSFEHLAKRLNQTSCGSLRSNISALSDLSRSSSHRSWNFESVTGLLSIESANDPESFCERINEIIQAQSHRSRNAFARKRAFAERDVPMTPTTFLHCEIST